MSIKEALQKTFFYNVYIYFKKRKVRNRYLNQHYGSNKKAITKAKLACLLLRFYHADFYRLKGEDKTFRELKEFVTYIESSSYMGSHTTKNTSNILKDKWLSYNHFKDFYGRRVALIKKDDLSSGAAMEKLNFVAGDKQDKRIIFKPLTLNRGIGIKLFDSPEDAFSYIREKGSGIVEQIIIQNEDMASFNHSSVNTVRIHSVNYGDRIDVKWPCLRVGRKGSVVDNAGAGGIFVAIDVEAGVTVAACDEARNTYVVHPDSQKNLIGFQVPRWKEACELTRQLARLVPEAAFVGWDLALTDNGWIMVEGNGFPLIIYQIATNKGLRKEFDQIRKKMDGNSSGS